MRRALPFLLASLPILTGCIERPVSPRDRYKVDRSQLGDVLLSEVPSVTSQVGAVFDDAIELIGYDIDPRHPSPGERVRMTFYYRALDEVDDDWTIFVHVDDPRRSGLRVSADHAPAGGRFRTPAWEEGDVVKDSFEFVAPSAAGVAEVWTGFYKGAQRLRLARPGRGGSDGQNRLRVARLEIR